MVCRECGAYNAEHLSHCRVCAAKLRDDPDPSEKKPKESKDSADAGKPSREFVQAPSWPSRPYAGAPERPAYTPPKKDADADEIFDDEYDTDWEDDIPTPPKAAAPEPVRAAVSPAPAVKSAAKPVPSGRVCSVCGKPMLPDAPFCAYCGSHEGLPGAEGQAPLSNTGRRPAPAQPVKARKAAADEFDDDFDDEDEKPAKKGAKVRKQDLDRDDFDDDDDEDDDEYYDEDEDDDMPRKRGKGTAALFWVLILLLVALIGVFGAYIVKKNFGGDVNNLIAAVMGTQQSGTAGQGDAATGDPAGVADDDSKMFTAEIGTDVDAATGTDLYVIDVYAPTGSTVKIKTTTELVDNGETTIPTNNHVILTIPQSAFLPNEPLSSETITIKPEITVVTLEGETRAIDVPEVTKQAEVLSITIESPATETVANTYTNDAIPIVGTVADHTVSVFVNGEQVTVYEGGQFQASYQPTGGETAETITIEAKKNNCVTATKTITVEPYVMQNASLTVSNDVSVKTYGLRAKDGKVTVTGTTVPGAKVTGTCANAKVTFGESTVSSTGEYQLPVTVGTGGAFEITLTASAEGYVDATVTAMVERLPNDDSSKYKKACTTLKAEQHAKIVAGSTTSGDFVFTGTITEITGTEPYEIVKMKLSTGEEIMVTNRSAKNRFGSDDLNKKKTVAGSLVGLYSDTKLPYLWVWYVWNAN